MLDALLQLVGFHAGVLGFHGHGRASRVGETRFLHAVTPTTRLLEYRIGVRRVQRVVADGRVLADGVPCLTASDLAVCILPGGGTAPAAAIEQPTASRP